MSKIQEIAENAVRLFELMKEEKVDEAQVVTKEILQHIQETKASSRQLFRCVSSQRF